MATNPKLRTSLKFSTYSDGALLPFSGKVLVGLTSVPAFSKAPVSAAELSDLREAFNTALAEAVKGSPQATAEKNAARQGLVDALTDDALYVQIVSKNDLPLLLSSGYEAVSTNRAQSPLEPPAILAVEQPSTGVLKARVKSNPNTRSFLGRIKEAEGGEYGPVLSFESSRKILFGGLKAGVLYVFQLCAVGGSTGKSDWTEPVTKMAM